SPATMPATTSPRPRNAADTPLLSTPPGADVGYHTAAVCSIRHHAVQRDLIPPARLRIDRRVTDTAADAPRPVAPISLDALLAGALLLAGAIVFLWYAPGSYQIYLALHVLAVVVWVGGDITLTTLGIVFEGRRDGPTLAALGRMGSWIGTRIYTPALFFVFGFGVALVEKSGIGWGHFWIVFAVVGWSLAMAIGIGFVGPELGRIDRAAQ